MLHIPFFKTEVRSVYSDNRIEFNKTSTWDLKPTGNFERLIQSLGIALPYKKGTFEGEDFSIEE
ncbi:hypothetical protein Dfri01_27830 [Dyadobacter frigoris]|nr:hypothetical protein Dfri01_27830 [Dyadobacter frigoris]